MKRKNLFFLFLFPILLLVLLASCDTGDNIIGKSFIAPGRTLYETGDTLDLTGGKVVYYYEDDEVSYDITTEMLDSSTVPSFTEAGDFVIEGSFEGFDFEFSITIKQHNDLLGVSFIAPGRTLYETGDTLDLTGGKVVYYYEDEEVSHDLTIEMLDSSTVPNFTEAGDFVIKGSHEDFDFEFDITITLAPVTLTDIEVKVDEELTTYIRTSNVTEYIKCRELYSDGSTGEWYSISDADIDSIMVENGEASINLSFLINNETTIKSVKLPVLDDNISVNQLLTSPVDSSYVVNGVVIAITTTVSRTEVILADKTTKEIISVSNLQNAGNVHGLSLDIDLEIGDEIIIPVVLKNSTLASDSGKLYAVFDGGNYVYNSIISKGNEIDLDYTNATVVDSQADLINLLSPENRGNNVYKVVKFLGQMNFITYQSSRHFRFWFEDGNIDNYDDQKIEGNMSPCFCDGTQYYTTGKNFGELVFGDELFVSEDWANPATKVVEMYALFIGGNGYYHEFVILDTELYKELEVVNTNTYFVAPETLNYVIDSTLSIVGAQIVKEYDLRSDVVIDVTMDMLDAETIPDFKTEGEYVITGSYEGFEFSFTVVVEGIKISSIAVLNNPTKTVYGHRQTLTDIDLTGGQISVEYSNGSQEVVDMDVSMLPSTDENWKLGEVEYVLSYGGKTTTITITYENQALTIAEALAGTVDEKYEVTGIVVGPASSAGAIELIIKDKNSMKTVGIYNSGVAGSASAPSLDTEVVNVGDEIIFTATLKQSSANGASNGKYYLSGNVANSVIIVSSGNEITYDFTDAFVIDTQEKLIEFLNNEDRFYSYVKIVQPKAVAYKTTHLRLFLGDSVTKLSEQKINGYSPVFHTASNNVYLPNGIASYFENATSTSYSEPATSNSSFYALFVGGNTYYHMFTVLGESLIVTE